MKKQILILALIPLSISAQQYPDTDKTVQAEMKKMMETMQKMQNCMQKIDNNEIKILERKGKVFDNEIQSLCKKGNRDQAQQKANEIIKVMMSDPIALKLKKCTDIMQDMPTDISVEDAHVCDSPIEMQE